MNGQVDSKSANVDKSALINEMVFEGMHRAFAKAKDTNPNKFSTRSFILAGQVVEMRVVGRELAETMGSVFAHLETKDIHSHSPRLVIELWDQCETGIPSRVVSTREDLYLHPLYIWPRDGRHMVHQLQYSMMCFDRKTGHTVGCTPSVEELSLYERGRPLRVPLSIWHNDQDIPVIHTGLVSKNGQGVLLAGLSGAGKSTSAITCLCAGFSYLSDDLVGLQILPDGSCLGHSIYNSTFLEPGQLTHFPSLMPHALRSKYSYEDKLLVLLSQVFESKLERVTTIRAVALPRIVNSRNSGIRRASKGEALRVLAPSSLFGVPVSPGIRGFDKLTQLVERVPSYWLELGSDLREIPGCVERLLEEACRLRL